MQFRSTAKRLHCSFDSAAYVKIYACKRSTKVTTVDFGFAELAEAADLTGHLFKAKTTFELEHNWPAFDITGFLPRPIRHEPDRCHCAPHSPHGHWIIFVLEGETLPASLLTATTPPLPPDSCSEDRRAFYLAERTALLSARQGNRSCSQHQLSR